MRQKKLKYVNKEMLNSLGVITDIKKIDTFHKPSYLEIGSGKGQFISSLAEKYPSNHYIALEVNINVCYRIVEKKLALNLNDFSIILGDANHLLDYFFEHTMDGIYLNFSDPWPKAKHHKRRLTYPKFLRMYQTLLKEDGFLQFRTDHKDLFEDSLVYFENFFETIELNRNLDISEHMTEYEEKKRPFGPIYQWIGKVKKHVE